MILSTVHTMLFRVVKDEKSFVKKKIERVRKRVL